MDNIMTNPHKLILISDNALGEGKPFEQDQLGFSDYASIISDSLIESTSVFTIGIFGDWGTGKTSLMRTIQKTMQESSNVTTIWFNSWLNEKESKPVVALTSRIIEVLKNESNKDKVINKIILYLESFLYGISISSKVAIPGIVELEPSLSIKDSIDNFKEKNKSAELDRVLEEISRISSKLEKPIIIFIDDLDRCFPDNAINILESIKLVFSQIGFTFILGMSRAVIEGYLKHRYKNEYGINDFNGASYLDKIVQISFYIPPHNDRINALSNSLITNNLHYKNKDIIDVLPSIASSLGANPRSLIRFINGLIIDKKIQDHIAFKNKMKDIDIYYLAISRCIQIRWSSIFTMLASNDNLCEIISKWDVSQLYSYAKSDDYLISTIAKQFISDKELLNLLLNTSQGIKWLENHDNRYTSIFFIKNNAQEQQKISEISTKPQSTYIYYDHASTELALKISKKLIDSGVQVNVNNETTFNLLKNKSLIFCIGKDTSYFQENQIVNMANQNNRIIPIILPDSSRQKIPEQLKNIAFIDFSKGIDDATLSNLAIQLLLN